MRFITLLLASGLVFATSAHGNEIKTNHIVIHSAPDWLKRTRVEKVTDRIQMKLEWSIRKINGYWYTDQSEFEKAHGLGPRANAVTIHRSGVSTLHMGPQINNENFDEIFGHELVHVILFQKYKSAIPKWLEEGLANHLSRRGKVDYKWLASQAFPKDVTELAHPFKGDAASISYRYKASQAFAEMLDKKCDLQNLIRLSVERKMEDKMATYCEISDLNSAFQQWVTEKAK